MDSRHSAGKRQVPPDPAFRHVVAPRKSGRSKATAPFEAMLVTKPAVLRQAIGFPQGYRVCKGSIDAVEKALEKALTDVATDAAPREPAEEGTARPERAPQTPKTAAAAPAPVAKGAFDDMDDDIPF